LPVTITLDSSLDLHPQVALRPEPFGALAYHYGNRRLVFLKHPDVVAVVRSLGDHASLADALRANEVAESRWSSFLKALDSLVESDVITVRSSTGSTNTTAAA
jgi:putative mycofactocin binding protein MftB